MLKVTADDFRAVELAVVSIATCATAIITAFSKHAQRKRDEKKAEFDAAVATEVQKVKTNLADSDSRTTTSIGRVKDEVHEAKTIIAQVHTIVNSEKTAAMEDLKASRLLTLTLSKAMLKYDPKNDDLKHSVDIAQALYDQINKATDEKILADKRT